MLPGWLGAIGGGEDTDPIIGLGSGFDPALTVDGGGCWSTA